MNTIYYTLYLSYMESYVNHYGHADNRSMGMSFVIPVVPEEEYGIIDWGATHAIAEELLEGYWPEIWTSKIGIVSSFTKITLNHIGPNGIYIQEYSHAIGDHKLNKL